MTDEEFLKATIHGNVKMSAEEIAQILADRETDKNRPPKKKSLEERVTALEQALDKIK